MSERPPAGISSHHQNSVQKSTNLKTALIDENKSPNNNNHHQNSKLILEVEPEHYKPFELPTKKIESLYEISRPETKEDQHSQMIKVHNYRRQLYHKRESSPTSRNVENGGSQSLDVRLVSDLRRYEDPIVSSYDPNREREKLKQLQ